MAITRPDTRLKDQLIKTEAARLAQREIAEGALKFMLRGIPRLDPTAVITAVDALMDATDQYKASLRLVYPKGRRTKPKIAQARASVTALHKLLTKAQENSSPIYLWMF